MVEYIEIDITDGKTTKRFENIEYEMQNNGILIKFNNGNSPLFIKRDEIESFRMPNQIELPPTPPSTGGDCFIATILLDGEPKNHLNVFLLRGYRNNTFQYLPMGQKSLNFYYHISPDIANHIKGRSFLKSFLRVGLLNPCIKLIKFREWHNGVFNGGIDVILFVLFYLGLSVSYISSKLIIREKPS